jgi:outer membrane lipopolysaccharide assembly protein LptE/RlpB
MRGKLIAFMASAALLLLQSCSYKLDGASIPKEMKTINVSYFDNNAPLVVNNLAQLFTEAIKDRIRTQTRLSLVRGEADATLEGAITDYTIAPVAIQATSDNKAPVASQTRLTITVNVVYNYPGDKKSSFTQSFSRYKDFTGDLSSQEQNLIKEINKQLTEDIFNRAFANW